MSCPTCKGPLPDEKTAHSPFCSARCRSIDLMRWLDGSFRIPGEPVDPETLPPFHQERPSRGSP